MQEILRKAAVTAGCIVCMYGFFVLIKYIYTGINKDFGEGFFSGVFITFTLFYLGTRLRERRLRVTAPRYTDWTEN